MTTGTGWPGRRPIFGHVHVIMDTGTSIKISTCAVYFILSVRVGVLTLVSWLNSYSGPHTITVT
jgi:hypothetical protein